MKYLRTRGGVDPDAWVTGTLGFILTFTAYILSGPMVREMYMFILQTQTDADVLAVANLTDMLYNYGMLVIGGGYIIYILYSSFRTEAEDKLMMMRYK